MTKRSYFRLTRLPRKVAAHVDEATYRAVESIAERAGWNIPEAVRQCIRLGPRSGPNLGPRRRASETSAARGRRPHNALTKREKKPGEQAGLFLKTG